MYKEKNGNPEHDIAELFTKRWSPRAFDNQKLIKRSDLESILEAGRWAPSANNNQPWRCLVGLNFDETYHKIFKALNPSNAAWVEKAPVLVCLLSYSRWNQSEEINDWAEQDTGIFLGHLLLQATELGIHSHPMAGFSKSKITELFALPEHVKPMTCIAFGFYGDPGSLPAEKAVLEASKRERKNIDEFVLNKY